MKQLIQSKHRHLLEDEQVRRWYDNLCRGSKVTADVYTRRLGSICNLRGTTPLELVARGRKDEEWLCNFLMDLVSELERQGKAGSYIVSNLKAVKSWLSHNGVDFKRRIKVRGADDTPTLRGKQTLATGQLRSLFHNSPPHTRCASALLAQAGLRPEVVGNYEATDGLTVGDLPEMKVEGGNIAFLKIPTMITVRRELSKAGHQYFTFLAREGCEYLQEYLTQRIRSGEEIDPSSPLVAPERSSKHFLRTSLVGKLVRKRLRECNIQARPYDLRHTFATQLMLAESPGPHPQTLQGLLHGSQGGSRTGTQRTSIPSLRRRSRTKRQRTTSGGSGGFSQSMRQNPVRRAQTRPGPFLCPICISAEGPSQSNEVSDPTGIGNVMFRTLKNQRVVSTCSWQR